jgi:uncharacterized damage-inducible protein DinB
MADWLMQTEPDVLYQKALSSFHSIDYTIQHILRLQKFWLAFIAEKDISNFNWSVRENEVEQILNELVTVSAQMTSVCSLFTESDLLNVLHLDMPWCKNDLSRYEYIVHAINHSTYHRGQVVTIARNLGITEGIVNTDYNFFNTGSL